jgi:sensor histidine kinase YesM
MKVKSIKQKIAYNVLIVGVATFIILSVMAYFIIVPAIRNNMIEAASQTTQEIEKQMSTLNAYIADYTENLALAVENNQNIMEYFSNPSQKNKNIASIDLNKLISSEGLARSVILCSEQGLVLDSINQISEADYQLLQTDWYKNLSQAEYARGFSDVYRTNKSASSYTAAYLKNMFSKNQKYTYLVFFGLDNFIYNIKSLAESLDYCALADTGGNLFYVLGDEKWNEAASQLIDGNIVKGYKNIDGSMWFMENSLQSKWRVISAVSNDTITASFSRYIIIFTLATLLFLVLLLVTLYQVINHMLKPMSSLVASMEEVAQGNLDCRIEIKARDEIGKLGQAFNQMTSDLKRSLQLIEEKEKQENKAKFSLLVSQINPHFIYNTLNSINYLARRKDTDAIIKVNTALIYILQDRLRVNDIQIFDSIGNELKVIEQYILIQRYMYEGELNFYCEVEEELLTEQIPKNLIQPLVENSLFHGLISEESGEITGEIKIQISKEEDVIVIKVIDNGKGMTDDKLKQVRNGVYTPQDRGKKIGLNNVRGRLLYLYGNQDCMTIESDPQTGTCITLRLKNI